MMITAAELEEIIARTPAGEQVVYVGREIGSTDAIAEKLSQLQLSRSTDDSSSREAEHGNGTPLSREGPAKPAAGGVHPEQAGSAKLSVGKISRKARSTHFIRSAMHQTRRARRLAWPVRAL
jgi:hypothetical protein